MVGEDAKGAGGREVLPIPPAAQLLTQIDAPLKGTVLNEAGRESAYAYRDGGSAYYRGTPTATKPAGNGGRVRRTKTAS